MSDFIVTRPARGTDTLHVAGCANVHHRATRQTLTEAANGYYPTMWRRVDEACVTPLFEAYACSLWDAARDEWAAEQDRRRAEDEARAFADWIKGRAEALEYLHQFLPLRDAVQKDFPKTAIDVEVSTSDWKRHPSILLDGVWHGTAIVLRHDRSTGRLSITHDFSVNVSSAAEARRLARALGTIENFVATP